MSYLSGYQKGWLDAQEGCAIKKGLKLMDGDYQRGYREAYLTVQNKTRVQMIAQTNNSEVKNGSNELNKA